MTGYQDPSKVDSPRGRWKLFDVLHDGGEGADSLAVGEWDGERVLASRWNGHDGSVGNPQSRGLPTWFIIPSWLYDAILKGGKIPANKAAIAQALLGL